MYMCVCVCALYVSYLCVSWPFVILLGKWRLMKLIQCNVNGLYLE